MRRTGKRRAVGLGENGPASPAQRTLAWGVHLFTASGVVCCLLAIEAGLRSDWRQAFAWLLVGVLIDAVDGALARRVRVKEALPNVDGSLLDNLLDYVSYVIVPALFLHWAGLLPGRLSFATAAAVCIASAFQFCQADAKTADHYFKGFPSYWNVSVLYLLALRLSPAANFAILVVLIVLVFVPIKYLYPSRTVPLRNGTLALTSLWGVMMIAVVWQLPDPSSWLVCGSLLYVVYYFAASLYLTLVRRRESR